jgi:predicted transcriptional regulator
MAKTVTVRMDDSTYRRIKSAAEAERRTISNFIEYATLAYVESSSFIDDDEMAGILQNAELIGSIRKAMDDIKKGNYRLVDA